MSKLIVMVCSLAVVCNNLDAKALCGALEKANPELLLRYLRGDRAALVPECAVYAIEQLGQKCYAPAADVLVKYLDFRRPGADVKSSVVVLRIPWLSDKYPAAGALIDIGIVCSSPRVITPSLVRVIGDAGSSDVLHDNAVEVLWVVHREDIARAVAALKQASGSASESIVANRLLDAARKVVSKCPGEQLAACSAALVGR